MLAKLWQGAANVGRVLLDTLKLWGKEPGQGPQTPPAPTDSFPDEALSRLDPPPATALDGTQPGIAAAGTRRQGLSLCIDLGTFASTVASDWNNEVELAVLSYRRAPHGGSAASLIASNEVSSTVLWVGDRPFMDADSFGDMADHSGADVSQSFKRLLFEYLWFGANPKNLTRLSAIYEELLLLTLAPRLSTTLHLLRERLKARADGETGPGSEAHRLETWEKKGGLQSLRDPRQLEDALTAGVRLRLCIPNAFDAKSVSIAVGHLNTAFKRVAGKVCPRVRYGPVKVSTIREAEAVAWAVPDAQPSELTLVLDVGAGTTDAALVRIGQGVTPRVVLRTGMPFGGDDVELVLLAAAYRKANRLADLKNLPRGQRLAGKRAVRIYKEAWSDTNQELRPEERAFLGGALAAIDDALPLDLLGEGQTEGVIVPMYAPPAVTGAEPTQSSVDVAPLTVPGFVDFLRLAVWSTCEPLLLAAKGALTRVFLSGAASYTPGVAVALQALLDKHVCGAKIMPIADVLATAPGLVNVAPVRRAKIACVYGGTLSLPFSDESDQTQLTEALRVEIFSPGTRREYDLFAAGEQLHDGQLLASYAVRGGRVEHTFTVYRYFTPHEYIALRHRTSSWVRRFIARSLVPRQATGLIIRLRQERGGNDDVLTSLLAWTAEQNFPDRLQQLQVTEPMHPPRRGQDESPLTGLPLEWLWETGDV